jgi:transposase-like protein
VSKARDANREEFWRQAVRRRTESGMTIVDFCAAEGLKPTAYHYWQREIKRRGALPSQPMEPSGKPTLAAVQVIDDRDDQSGVEIVAKNGYVVRVGERATAEHVRRVLQAVSELD